MKQIKMIFICFSLNFQMNLIVSKCWQGQPKKGVHTGAEILTKYFKDFQNVKHTNIPTKHFNNKLKGYQRIFKANNKAFRQKIGRAHV